MGRCGFDGARADGHAHFYSGMVNLNIDWLAVPKRQISI
jgi:hypothetical protein